MGFEKGSGGTLLDAANAKKVKAFIEAFNTVRVVIGTQNALHISETNVVLELSAADIAAVVQDDISALQSDLGDAQANIGTLQTDLAAAEADIASVTADEAAHYTAQGAINDAIAEDITGLLANVADFETRIAALETLLAGATTTDIDVCELGTVTFVTK